MSRYGRFHVAEPLHNLALFHRHAGEALKPVDHEPPLAVLDQQDLLAQGIRCSSFIHGATDVDALGSCTANATTAHISGLGAGPWADYTGALLHGTVQLTDAVGAEKAAITFYNRCTDQTGDTSTEWPPTDCGSSGPFLAQEAIALGVVRSQRLAHGAQNVVSLLQGGTVLQGSPFFYAWETPDANGFVDGNGRASDLEAAIRSGVAGGHETLITAIERLSLSATDVVEPEDTVLRVRNSWGKAWGDAGSFRIHLSTLVMLAGYCDFRQFVA